jgi:flagellin
MLSINTNTNALFSMANLSKTNRALNNISKQLSTGKRINSAADDAAGISIASKMDSRVRGLTVAKKNVADAMSLIGIADGGLQGIEESLQKMREIALSSKSDTLSVDERTALKTQFDSIVSEINDYAGQATFNGIDLLDGSADLSIQSGANAGDTTQVTIGQDYSASGLSVDSLTIDSSANAATTIAAIDAALGLTNSGMSDLGAMTNRFDSKSNYIDNAIENNTAALELIEDADMAEVAAENIKLQTKQQTNLFALSQAIQMPQSILSLLG